MEPLGETIPPRMRSHTFSFRIHTVAFAFPYATRIGEKAGRLQAELVVRFSEVSFCLLKYCKRYSKCSVLFSAIFL